MAPTRRSGVHSASRASRSKKKGEAKATASSLARSTVSGPTAKPDLRASDDTLGRKLVATGKLAAALSTSATAIGEYRKGAALNPPAGATAEPEDPAATGSTVSEMNGSPKLGSGTPQLGKNSTIDSLDRVRADASGARLTTNQGVPIADNQNSLKVGLRGPALLEDFILREKITHFDHERIPERIVHARGSGAHGTFECYEPLGRYTRASLFAEAGKRTPVFVRFSTVAGERGSADTARDVRGFAVKFYTDEGVWDLVGNNIPIFFIQDAMKFPDLIHAAKPEPNNAMPQAATAHDTFWDFVSLSPESTAMLLWTMSDRAIPRSYRMMQGFGVHTFRFVNAQQQSVFVKFHWNPLAGTHSLLWDEAVRIAGADSDFHRRDLWEAIEAGAYPEWELAVQIFTEADAERWSFDVLDPTKLVPEELVPLTPIGRLTLNRNPDNFFAETEQVAFCTAHVVPGIDFSNDPLLAGRIHSYLDTQITRLGGPNFHELPINAPLAPVANNQRDGLHRQTIHRGRVAYEPNSLGGGCPFQAGASGFVSFPEERSPADHKVRGKPERFADHYTQARLFWRSQSEVEQQHIVGAFRFELTRVQITAIRERMVANLLNVDEGLAQAVAEGLGIEVLPKASPKALAHAVKPEVKVSPALSLFARPGDRSIRTRQVALLVADGVDGPQVAALREILTNEGAVPRLIGPRLGSVASSEDRASRLDVDVSLEAAPSVLFDAVALPAGVASALISNGLALEFIREQYRHCKPMFVAEESLQLLEIAGVKAGSEREPVEGIVIGNSNKPIEAVFAEFLEAIAAHRALSRDRDPPGV